MSDRDLISTEVHELNYLLKKWKKRSTQENRDLLKNKLMEFKKDKKYKNHNRKNFYYYVEDNKTKDLLEDSHKIKKVKNIVFVGIDLCPPIGAVKKSKRIGRGPGSGMGKTSTKGHKGQKARKGGGTRLGFEGGQTPLFRRLPKRGFSNARFKKDFNEINLFMLDKFGDGAVIKKEDLKKMGLIAHAKLDVKILGKGEIKKKIEIYANKFSKSAIEKIEKAGGKVYKV